MTDSTSGYCEQFGTPALARDLVTLGVFQRVPQRRVRWIRHGHATLPTKDLETRLVVERGSHRTHETGHIRRLTSPTQCTPTRARAVPGPRSARRPGRCTGRSPEGARTVFVTALREYLRDVAHDDALTPEIAAAYYDDELSFD